MGAEFSGNADSSDLSVGVLLIEDSATYAAIARGLMGESTDRRFNIETVETLAEGVGRAVEGGIDIIVLDLTLPDSEGLTTFRTLRSAVPDTPVVVLTGLDDAAVGTKAVALGAQDYLVKGKTDRHLVRSVVYALERHRLVREVEGARREAERASQAKSEFLSRMSHELRTPLNAIVGFAQLLALDETDDDRRDYAARILRAGNHLTTLIDELLDISRIEAGRLTLRIEATRLSAVIGDAMSIIEPLAMRRGIELRRADAVDGWVAADTQRLRQVLVNLLSNAVKYNRSGGSVTVEVAVPGQLDGLARVKVTDEGEGIRPEVSQRLFEPFDRLGAEQSGIEGTGLGLALSRGLVEAMGGAIGATSVPGAGSTFHVDMPVTRPPSDAAAVPPTGETVPPSATGETVLYIEDDASNLMLVERILAHRPGVRFLGATDGSRGIELASKRKPGLILLDLRLPDMNGQDVLASLKADPDTAKIPVVVLTADTRPGLVRELIESGAADHLSKPLDVHSFLVVVDRLLAGP